MLSQKYVYEGVIIEAKYEINYVIIEMYTDYAKVHESITYLDGIKILPHQIPRHLIEMVIGEPFELKKFEVVKTEYIDD